MMETLIVLSSPQGGDPGTLCVQLIQRAAECIQAAVVQGNGVATACILATPQGSSSIDAAFPLFIQRWAQQALSKDDVTARMSLSALLARIHVKVLRPSAMREQPVEQSAASSNISSLRSPASHFASMSVWRQAMLFLSSLHLLPGAPKPAAAKKEAQTQEGSAVSSSSSQLYTQSSSSSANYKKQQQQQQPLQSPGSSAASAVDSGDGLPAQWQSFPVFIAIFDPIGISASATSSSKAGALAVDEQPGDRSLNLPALGRLIALAQSALRHYRAVTTKRQNQPPSSEFPPELSEESSNGAAEIALPEVCLAFTQPLPSCFASLPWLSKEQRSHLESLRGALQRRKQAAGQSSSEDNEIRGLGDGMDELLMVTPHPAAITSLYRLPSSAAADSSFSSSSSSASETEPGHANKADVALLSLLWRANAVLVRPRADGDHDGEGIR